MIRSRVNLSTAICSDSSQLPITAHPQWCAEIADLVFACRWETRAQKGPGSREPGPVSWRKSGALLVLDLVVHQAVLDLVQGVHRLHHGGGLGLGPGRHLGRLLDDLLDCDRAHPPDL